METMADRINERMRAKDLSGSDVARYAGVSRSNVHQWRAGTARRLWAENFLKLCEILECDPWWLMTGTARARDTVSTSRLEAILQAAYALITESAYEPTPEEFAGAVLVLLEHGADDPKSISLALSMLERSRAPERPLSGRAPPEAHLKS